MTATLIEFARDLKSKVPIELLVREYVPELVQRGRVWQARCPFHEEKTPSFNVNPEFGFYHCFGCNAHGDSIKFVQEIERIDFRLAVETIARRFNVAVPEFRGGGKSGEERTAEEKRKAALLEVCRLAEDWFCHQLQSHPAAARAREYLAGRGLSEDQVRDYRLGFAPPGYENLLAAADKRGFAPKLVAEAGLASARERGGGGFYDRFRDRIMFPIQDAQGRTVAFGGRLMEGEGPKYLNSSDTPLFHKGNLLYGLAAAREAIRDRRSAVLVEGYMDWIALHSHGVGNVVAGLGTAFGREQARLLKRLTGEVTVLYDGDEAGRKAMFRAGEHLLTEGLTTRAVALEAGHDPDSYVREAGAEALAGLIEAAPGVIEYFVDAALEEGPPRTPEAKVEVVYAVAPLIRSIPAPELKEAWVARLRTLLGLHHSGALTEALGQGQGWAALREKGGAWSRAGAEAGQAAKNGVSGGGVGALGGISAGEKLEYCLLNRMATYVGHWPLFEMVEPDLIQNEQLSDLFSVIYGAARDAREGAEPPEDWFSLCNSEQEIRTMSHILSFDGLHLQGALRAELLNRSLEQVEQECREIVARLRRRRAHGLRRNEAHEVRKTHGAEAKHLEKLMNIHAHSRSVLQETENLLRMNGEGI